MNTDDNFDELTDVEPPEGSSVEAKKVPKGAFWSSSKWKPEKCFCVVLAKRLVSEMPDHWPGNIIFGPNLLLNSIDLSDGTGLRISGSDLVISGSGS